MRYFSIGLSIGLIGGVAAGFTSARAVYSNARQRDQAPAALRVRADVAVKTQRCEPSGKPHLFALDDAATTLCVPQKNGNRNWAGFAFYLHRARAPRDANEVLRFLRFHRLEWEQLPVGGDSLVIARNPYARVLSEYLHHVAADGCVGSAAANGGQLGCDGHDGSRDPNRQRQRKGEGDHETTAADAREKATPAHFERWLTDALRGGADAACARNHHLCTQASLCGVGCLDWPPVILKLERQHRWFDALVRKLGANREGLFGDEWRGFAGQSAFYLPDDSAPTIDAVHATNATGRLRELHTVATIDLVGETYGEDFAILGYCKGRQCIERGDLD